MRLYRRRKSNREWVWWASWTEGGRTIRRSTRCRSKAAAEVVIARWERERADPVYAAANQATFGVEAGLFLRACELAEKRGRMREGTVTMYRQKAGALVRILGADLRLAAIDGSTFPGYLDARRADYLESTGKHITESTLYKEWVTFHNIMAQAWRAQRYGRDPRSLKPQHFGPEYRPRETALTWEQIDKLLEVLPESRRGPVRFALATGARRSEVFRARPDDVHVSDRADTWLVTLRGTKTATSARTIPIPEPMRRLFAGLRRELPFPAWPNARRALARACKRAGVPAVTWNDLRRTFASLLVQAGAAPHVVARLLGHTTTAMVDRVYGRQTTESLAELLERQLREPRVTQATADQSTSQRKRRTR